MKKKQWLQSLNGVDDKYVAEAAPTGAARKRSGKALRLISILAACMAFVLLAGTLALFIPYNTTPPSVKKYADSDYYSLIQKLNEYNYDPPAYKNTFDLLTSLPELFVKFESDMTSGEGMDPEDNNYQEITDNQVSGVIEADLIKRSDTHVYYLSSDLLLVYSIQGKDSKRVGRYDMQQYGIDNFQAQEFFLSADCRTLTVLATFANKSGDRYLPFVKVIVLDVSDPAAIKEISNTDVSGDYLSSRLTEHGLLLMTTMRCHNPDYADERTFVPQIETEDGLQSLPLDDIVCPETLSNASYTVMLMMDATGQRVIDSTAFLSYSEDVYVSKDAIYATRSYREYGEIKNGEQKFFTVSEISCMGYGANGFDKRGSVTVDGFVLDQYSMDQHQNTLRVVTTTEQGTQGSRPNAYRHEILSLFALETNASLYVIDLDTMQITASVKQFAPKGESVRSVRFEGDAAYVCTAVQLTDPVFFFDLSDLNDITYKETGTIEGFSSSLVNFGDGYLLGIGRGGNGNELKLEIYTEGEQSVDSYASIELPCTEYYPDYKCYYIDRENGLVGLGIHTWDKIMLEEYHAYRYENYRYGYIVLHFDGHSISEVLRIEYGEQGNMRQMRGVYIDGYYYVFNGTHFDVKPLVLE